MKHLLVSLLLIVLVSGAVGEPLNAGGYDQVVIQANQDPQACLLRLTAQLHPTHITIQQDIYNPMSNCPEQNLQFASMFNNSVLGNLTLAATSNPNIRKGKLNATNFQQYNGSACVQIHPGNGDDVYLCRFKYGEALLHLWFMADRHCSVIQTNWNGLWFPLVFSTEVVPQNDTLVWKASASQNANLVGQLYQACDSWSTSIPSASNQVYVNGTIYSSQPVNLGAILSNFVMYSAIVHPRAAALSEYTAKWVNSNGFFANQTGYCSDLNVNYGSIANMGDCKNGCDVTFILIKSSGIYTLQTKGFTYSGARLRA